MDSKNSINDYAHEKFVELRSKLKLNVQKPILKETITLTQEQIDNMMGAQSASVVFDEGIKQATEAARNVDNVFNFIDSLNLHPQLSLAIGLIISGHRTENKEDIAKAIVALGEYCNGQREKETNAQRT